MKRIYLLFFMAFMVLVPAFAQSRPGGSKDEKRRELREYKMKYLAQEMDLSGDVQKQFFEVYDQLSDERGAVRREIRMLNRKIKENNATDADYESLNKAKDKFAEIDKRYDSKFSTFLSGKQIYKMKEAEAVFMKKMRELRESGRKR